MEYVRLASEVKRLHVSPKQFFPEKKFFLKQQSLNICFNSFQKKCSQERLSSYVLTSDPKWTGIAFHYGITSDPLRINFISPYSNKDWSKFDLGSAIDWIPFELVEREFKVVYVIKNCSSSYQVSLRDVFFCLVTSLGKRKSSESL